jgi:hypothetical protein
MAERAKPLQVPVVATDIQAQVALEGNPSGSPHFGPPTVRPSKPAGCGRARPARPRTGPGDWDRALYGCGCGKSFEAPVSTSVHCPDCGEPQAW